MKLRFVGVRNGFFASGRRSAAALSERKSRTHEGGAGKRFLLFLQNRRRWFSERERRCLLAALAARSRACSPFDFAVFGATTRRPRPKEKETIARGGREARGRENSIQSGKNETRSVFVVAPHPAADAAGCSARSARKNAEIFGSVIHGTTSSTEQTNAVEKLVFVVSNKDVSVALRSTPSPQPLHMLETFCRCMDGSDSGKRPKAASGAPGLR